MDLTSSLYGASAYIRVDGGSTTTARIPFAAGIQLNNTSTVLWGNDGTSSGSFIGPVYAGIPGFQFKGGQYASGAGINTLLLGGDATAPDVDGGVFILLGGSIVSNALYGYCSVGYLGSPNKIVRTSVDAISSFYIYKNLEVDGTAYFDSTVNLSSLTASRFLKLDGSKNIVSSTAATIDISSETNLAVTSPITLTGDTVGFDATANFTWSGTHNFTGTAFTIAPVSGTFMSSIVQPTDHDSIFLSFVPNKYNDTTGIGSEPPVKRWNFSISEPAVFGGLVRPDRPVGFGYNIANGGGALDSSADASFGITFEDYYGVSGDDRQFEFYLQSIVAGTATQYRPIHINVKYPTPQSNTTPEIDMALVYGATGRISFNTIDNVQRFSLFSNLFILNSGSTFYKSGNNQQWIVQENAAASATKSLIYLNSADTVILGQSGIPVKTVSDFSVPDSGTGSGPYLNIGDNSQAAGYVSIQNDQALTGDCIFQPQAGFGGAVFIQDMDFKSALNVTCCTSTAFDNMLLVGAGVVAAQATPTPSVHGIFSRKGNLGTSGIIAGVFEAEFSSSSNSSSQTQGLNVFAHTANGTVGNLTQATGAGGLRGGRSLIRQRGSGTIARATAQAYQWNQDATTGTVTDSIGLLIEAPTIGTASTTTNWYGIKCEAATVYSGTLTNSYYIYCDEFLAGTNRYEIWMANGAKIQFREAGQKIYSSGSKTLDYDASSSGIHNFRIGTSIEVSIQADTMTFNSGSNDPVLSWATDGALKLTNGRFGVEAGNASSKVAQVGGTIDVNTTTVGNVGTGEDDLITYSVPANILSTNGDAIQFVVAGNFDTSLVNKRVRIYFGATAIFDTGTLTTPAGDWAAYGTIVRTGATTQRAVVFWESAATTLPGSCDYTTPGETLSGAVTFKVTGEASNTNDVQEFFHVIKWMPVN